jgi:hypothetical protein
MAVHRACRVCSVAWYPALIGVLELILNGRFTARPAGVQRDTTATAAL